MIVNGSLYPKVAKYAVEVKQKGLADHAYSWYLNRHGTAGIDVHLFDTEEIARHEMDKYLKNFPGQVSILKVNIQAEVIHTQPELTA